MPRGPKGEKRPADVIAAAIMVGRIATGEIEEGAGAPPDDGKERLGLLSVPAFCQCEEPCVVTRKSGRDERVLKPYHQNLISSPNLLFPALGASIDDDHLSSNFE
jgi:hypothetical protein